MEPTKNPPSRYKDFVPAGEDPGITLNRCRLGKDSNGNPVFLSGSQDFIPGPDQIAEKKAAEAEKGILATPPEPGKKISNADRRFMQMGVRFVQHYMQQPHNARKGIIKALKSQAALSALAEVERIPALKQIIEERMKA